MKAGTVAVIGRANAGKSTLVNVLVGEKVSIVSPKPQTTRDRILGVLTTDDYQIVFEDTPGIYKADNALNSLMQRTAEQTAKDVDAVLLVADVHEGLKESDEKLNQARRKERPAACGGAQQDGHRRRRQADCGDKGAFGYKGGNRSRFGA